MAYQGDPQQYQQPPPPYATPVPGNQAPVAYTQPITYASPPIPGAYDASQQMSQQIQQVQQGQQVQQFQQPTQDVMFEKFQQAQLYQPPANQQQMQLQQQFQQFGFAPEKLAMVNQAVQQQQQVQQTQQIYAAPPITPNATPGQPPKVTDDQKSGKMKRFMGDTLMGRFVRSGIQTATTTLKMPAALSPWGDNNPVTLPNVRYRDAVLFTTFAFVGAPLVDGADSLVGDLFGADHFVSEIVGSTAGFIVGNTVVKYGVFQIVEQAIDKGIIEHILPEEEKMIRTTNVKTLQVAIKHKLMGVDADIRLVGVYNAQNPAACDKGWFCPYLFASARTPMIPRAYDFAIAQFFGPFVAGKLDIPTDHRMH
jgi:hypothetical protein